MWQLDTSMRSETTIIFLYQKHKFAKAILIN